MVMKDFIVAEQMLFTALKRVRKISIIFDKKGSKMMDKDLDNYMKYLPPKFLECLVGSINIQMCFWVNPIFGHFLTKIWTIHCFKLDKYCTSNWSLSQEVLICILTPSGSYFTVIWVLAVFGDYIRKYSWSGLLEAVKNSLLKRWPLFQINLNFT